MADITPGSKINIKVVRTPNTSGAKTIERLLNRDVEMKAEQRRLAKVRKSGYNPQPRGGRLYGGQMVKQHPVKGELGESGTIVASIDILDDIASVEQYVEITPA